MVCFMFLFVINCIFNIVKIFLKFKMLRGNIFNQCFVEEMVFKNNQSYFSFVNYLKDMRGKYYMYFVIYLMYMFEIVLDFFVYMG